MEKFSFKDGSASFINWSKSDRVPTTPWAIAREAVFHQLRNPNLKWRSQKNYNTGIIVSTSRHSLVWSVIIDPLLIGSKKATPKIPLSRTRLHWKPFGGSGERSSYFSSMLLGVFSVPFCRHKLPRLATEHHFKPTICSLQIVRASFLLSGKSKYPVKSDIQKEGRGQVRHYVSLAPSNGRNTKAITA